MAKRLKMTTADYVAIAVSPALIMALVGSLVFFLIAVMYIGEYQARLNYAFALFVFAAVLIARISIEMGSERAALFALPLGIAMFLFMVKFIEQPSPLSHLINLALMVLVWWCAHRLTWDSTVIDDDEDASGEGLMQQVGVDEPAAGVEAPATPVAASSFAPPGSKENELLEADEKAAGPFARLWNTIIGTRRGPHMPGLWVFYFSLAALPLFGIGQHWVPASDVGRRRYVFSLLLVYVAAALALLVTTSFLNLRRYLRQRRVEMPLTIAGTWVGLGGVLIAIIMFAAALIPRPAAEIAMSRVPWQVGSPGGLSASRMSVNRDGGEEKKENEDATAGERTDEKSPDSSDRQGEGKAEGKTGKASSQAKSGDSQQSQATEQGKEGQSGSQAKDGKSGDQESEDSKQSKSPGSQAESQSASGQQSQQRGPNEKSGDQQAQSQSKDQSKSQSGDQQKDQSDDQGKEGQQQQAQQNQPDKNTPNEDRDRQGPGGRTPSPTSIVQSATSALGGLAGLLKIAFYVILALAVVYLVWKYRHQVLQTLAELWRQLLELFGARSSTPTAEQEEAARTGQIPSFAEFRDPFLTGQHARMPPEELVRYTFAAFEAWANDRGKPRGVDCTPQELVRLTLAADTPMFASGRRLARLYNEAAYAPFQISRESTSDLRTFWQQMRQARADVLTAATAPSATT
jgi:hypothetical protein